MVTIAIIGAGQIGRRHLQALTLINRPVHIQVVDPHDDSLQKAKTAYTEVPQSMHTQKVEYLPDSSLLQPEIDIGIVATSAKVRKCVVQNLLQNKKVRYLILEKVVFQHPDHFAEIDLLLTQKKVKAWVNCPMIMVPFYQQLKNKLMHTSPDSSTIFAPVDYRVSGSRWNIGSNAIHHLDLLSYLTNESDFILDSSLLDHKLLQSKRPGFMEFTGTLLGKSNHGSCLTMTSYSTGQAPLLIQISNENIRYIIKVNENKAWMSATSSNWKWSETDFNAPYQSRLTHLVVQQILNRGKCNLPTYHTSWKLHLPLLYSIKEHVRQYVTGSDDLCPIT